MLGVAALLEHTVQHILVSPFLPVASWAGSKARGCFPFLLNDIWIKVHGCRNAFRSLALESLPRVSLAKSSSRPQAFSTRPHPL